MTTEKDTQPAVDPDNEAHSDEDPTTPPPAIADSLPAPDDSGPGEQDHLDPMQQEDADKGGH